MQFGLDVPTTGAYADARVLAQMAADAEEAGWDGFFVWDVLGTSGPSAPVLDPWIALTAIALQTTRIKIGVVATPLARHRPWLVAGRLANLDQLSQGRIICAVGLGHRAEDFTAFGEASDPPTRAGELDEGLEILAGLWTQDAFSFAGQYYTLDGVTLDPKPRQTPRIPLWVAGGWPRRAPFRRAARWDGVCLKSVHADTRTWLTLDEFRACRTYVLAQRTLDTPFDVVMSGETPEDRQEGIARARAFAEAGATWWVEEGLGWALDELRPRIAGGPPRA